MNVELKFIGGGEGGGGEEKVSILSSDEERDTRKKRIVHFEVEWKFNKCRNEGLKE